LISSRPRLVAIGVVATLVLLLLIGSYVAIATASAPTPIPPVAQWERVTGEPVGSEVGFNHGEFVEATVGNPGVRFRYTDREPRYEAVKTALTSSGTVTILDPPNELERGLPSIWQLQKGGELVLSAEESIAQYQRARNGPQGLGTFLILIWALFLPVATLVWAIALKGRPPHTWRQTWSRRDPNP